MPRMVAGAPASVRRVVDGRRQVLAVLTALRHLPVGQWLQQGCCFRQEGRCQVSNARFRLRLMLAGVWGAERKCDVLGRPPSGPASA